MNTVLPLKFRFLGTKITPTQSDSNDVPGRSGSAWILLGNALEVSQSTHKSTNSPRAWNHNCWRKIKDKDEGMSFVWLPCSGGQGSLACCSPRVARITQLSEWTTIYRRTRTGYRYSEAEPSRKITSDLHKDPFHDQAVSIAYSGFQKLIPCSNFSKGNWKGVFGKLPHPAFWGLFNLEFCKGKPKNCSYVKKAKMTL